MQATDFFDAFLYLAEIMRRKGESVAVFASAAGCPKTEYKNMKLLAIFINRDMRAHVISITLFK